MRSMHHSPIYKALRALVAVVAVLTLLSAVAPPHAHQAEPGAPARVGPVSDAAAAQARLAADMHRFALNALLVPLLDDADPPHWVDPSVVAGCGEGTGATVDGRPIVAGETVPATAFTLRWTMDHCMPLGPASVELSGKVELVVFHDDLGFSAVVNPGEMSVDSWAGSLRLTQPFSAATAVQVEPGTPLDGGD